MLRANRKPAMPQTPATPSRPDPTPRLWDPAAATPELFSAWTCAWSAWGDYLNRLAAASGPMAVLEAGSQLMTDNLEICSRAAAARLRAGGLRAPLLNDA